jgi:hypothetical protein
MSTFQIEDDVLAHAANADDAAMLYRSGDFMRWRL